MDLSINPEPPQIMHIDLNSCFATVEQQAHRTLRDKPIVIAAYDTPRGCVLAPSIEAKEYGVKTGMRVKDARALCPQVIVRTADTTMIRDVHVKFKKIVTEYSSDVVPKSIDEVVINFQHAPKTSHHETIKELIDIGKQIKYRLRTEVGDWLKCNVGIATNRFLAKLASGLHKPDGLDVITPDNLSSIYQSISLVDLPGINIRYQARLNSYGITTPYEFFQTPLIDLKKYIFRSIGGYYWYLRLKGWEIDQADFSRKTFGQDYALKKKTDSPRILSRLLFKLCEKMGRRLRRSGYTAHGVHVGLLYDDHTYWHRSRATQKLLYTTRELYKEALYTLTLQEEQKTVVKLMVRCFNLHPASISQPTLFDQKEKSKDISKALDKINDTYGEFCITPALMMQMDNTILDRIAFGNVKMLEDLYV